MLAKAKVDIQATGSGPDTAQRARLIQSPTSGPRPDKVIFNKLEQSCFSLFWNCSFVQGLLDKSRSSRHFEVNTRF